MTFVWRASTRGSSRVEWMVVAVMSVLAAIAIPRVSGAF
jgi:Tfp pilus assembly protein FimT